MLKIIYQKIKLKILKTEGKLKVSDEVNLKLKEVLENLTKIKKFMIKKIKLSFFCKYFFVALIAIFSDSQKKQRK